MDFPAPAKDEPGERHSGGPDPDMTIRCWGARGSVPAPGLHTVRYGGNASCIEVRTGEERIILDGGTGLAEALIKNERHLQALVEKTRITSSAKESNQ